MRFVRLLLISFVLLFLLVTAISFFIPSQVRISKAINVKAPVALIWTPIANMDQWKDWNPFFADVDPATITRIDTGNGRLNAMKLQGTSISWKQKGQNEYIAAMEREGRKPVLNGWKMIQHAGSDSTTIQWYMDFQLRWYPWEKFASLLLERSYGPKMEQGLENLKKRIHNEVISYK